MRLVAGSAGLRRRLSLCCLGIAAAGRQIVGLARNEWGPVWADDGGSGGYLLPARRNRWLRIPAAGLSRITDWLTDTARVS